MLARTATGSSAASSARRSIVSRRPPAPLGIQVGDVGLRCAWPACGGAVGGRRSAVGGRWSAVGGPGGWRSTAAAAAAALGMDGGAVAASACGLCLNYFCKKLFVKKKIEAHAAPGGARRTFSAHALPNYTIPAPLSRRAIPPQRPTNAPIKNSGSYCLLCLSPGGSPRVLAGRPPAPCGVAMGVAPWLRRAPSVVCGCTITEMGRTHRHTGATLTHRNTGVAGRHSSAPHPEALALCRGRRRAPLCLCGLVSQMAHAATVSQRTGARYMDQ